jgi:hypothetical protein
LAGKSERSTGGLLLRETADLVVERVVNRYPAADVDSQTPGLREVGITHVVLRSGAGGPAQIRAPPVAGGAWGRRYEQAGGSNRSGTVLLLATAVTALLLLTVTAALTLGLESAAADQIRLVRYQAGEIVAESVDPAFQIVVEHIGQHDHSAPHPLAGAAEFGVIELGHAAVTGDHGFEHARYGIRTEAVPLRQIVDRLLAGGGEWSHREIPSLKFGGRG